MASSNPRIGKNKKNQRPCSRCSAAFDADMVQCPKCRHINVDLAYKPGDDGTVLLSDASIIPAQRIETGDWDPCWGQHIDDDGKEHSGIVTVSVTLLGGAPGAGKSTLSLQLADRIAKKTKREVLYISAEEGIGQIRSRAKRLKLAHINRIRIASIGVVRDLSSVIEHYQPAAIIADSLPKICPDMADAVVFADTIKEWTEKLGSPAIIIDHVTKEEEFAGLQALQHAVDTTLLFTVYDDDLRELRTVKNRNGPSGVKRFFDMTEEGLIMNAEVAKELEEAEDEDEDDE